MRIPVIFILSFFVASSCATKTPPKPEIVKPKVKPKAQCISGCMPNEGGQCSVTAMVNNAGRTETEEVPCDPRCCEEGATYIQGGVDSDNDRIYDSADQCPNEKEDYDGFHDKDGCPELDNDGDKILDDDDLCPLDPETMNGKDDEDGCPD